MKIFMSWSGERSQALATALKDWLPMVMQTIDPWLSQADISAGERWSATLAKELETSSFGIICVTRDNIAAPWILFEAGALAKDLSEGRVIPLLLDLDLKDLSGPLSQFQAKKADQTGMRDIVNAINSLAEMKLGEHKLAAQFEALWGNLEKKIELARRMPVNTEPKRSQGDILEDLVVSVRSIDLRLRDYSQQATSNSRRDEAVENIQHSIRALLDKSFEINNGEHKLRKHEDDGRSSVEFIFQSDDPVISSKLSKVTIVAPISKSASEIVSLIEGAIRQNVDKDEFYRIHWSASKILFN